MQELLKRHPQLAVCAQQIQQALDLMITTYKNGGKILVCGNGGSAADCEHIVGELMKGFISRREVTDSRIPPELRKNLQGALPAISLPSQCAVLSAFINDVEPDMMYAQLVYGYAQPQDLVMGLSTSGNSKNVVYALRVAACMDVKTLALTGERESQLSGLADVAVRVPGTETYKVQELHLPVYHYLCAAVERALF